MLTRFWNFLVANGARLAGFGAMATEIGGAIWNVHLHQPIDLGSLGAGLAAILTAIAAQPAAQALRTWQQTRLLMAQRNLKGEENATCSH